MLKIVESIQDESDETTNLVLDDQFLKNIEKGKKLLLRNIDGSNQFMIEILNNAKLKKNQVEPKPFKRSVYARGYQGFLTHENGKAKLIFDEKNWVTFDITSFAL